MELLLEFINSLFLGKEVWVWLIFVAVVATLLALDLGVLHKTEREID